MEQRLINKLCFVWKIRLVSRNIRKTATVKGTVGIWWLVALKGVAVMTQMLVFPHKRLKKRFKNTVCALDRYI